ncbi:MAG: hypothetical protein HY064_12505 [Bacteroidetes bacterium]|nr:hypothetical protein [Bacteroidota bacterium]
MRQFWKIPSLIQIGFAHMLAVIFISPEIIKLYEKIFVPAYGYHSPPLSVTDWVLFAIGLLLFAWLLYTIFRPGVHTATFNGVSHAGGFIFINRRSVTYDFSSSHPSYVFIDIIAPAFYFFLLQLDLIGWIERTYEHEISICIGLVIPFLRLFGWYVLRIKPNSEDDVAKTAWKPVAILYGFFVMPILILFLIINFNMNHQEAKGLANLTVVTEANWKGNETYNLLLDSAYNSNDGYRKNATRIIRLRVTQKGPPTICARKDDYDNICCSVLATLGKDEDVLLYHYTYKTEDNLLYDSTQHHQGKIIDVTGRLMPMPDENPTPWGSEYCGLENLNPQPKWVLEIENP